jgi:hypothetical protein
MKKFLLAVIALGGAVSCFAQDTTKEEKADTLHIGGMVIIKKKDEKGSSHSDVHISNKKRKNSNLTTNWWIVDLGFANFNDQTNYASAAAQAFAPGITSKEALSLHTGNR